MDAIELLAESIFCGIGYGFGVTLGVTSALLIINSIGIEFKLTPTFR